MMSWAGSAGFWGWAERRAQSRPNRLCSCAPPIRPESHRCRSTRRTRSGRSADRRCAPSPGSSRAGCRTGHRPSFLAHLQQQALTAGIAGCRSQPSPRAGASAPISCGRVLSHRAVALGERASIRCCPAVRKRPCCARSCGRTRAAADRRCSCPSRGPRCGAAARQAPLPDWSSCRRASPRGVPRICAAGSRHREAVNFDGQPLVR